MVDNNSKTSYIRHVQEQKTDGDLQYNDCTVHSFVVYICNIFLSICHSRTFWLYGDVRS